MMVIPEPTSFCACVPSFENEKVWLRAHLMAYFMHYIIYIEIISHRNSISRRSDTASFLSVYTNATNTTGVSTTAGSAEHVADIIICLTDHIAVKVVCNWLFQLPNVV